MLKATAAAIIDDKDAPIAAPPAEHETKDDTAAAYATMMDDGMTADPTIHEAAVYLTDVATLHTKDAVDGTDAPANDTILITVDNNDDDDTDDDAVMKNDDVMEDETNNDVMMRPVNDVVQLPTADNDALRDHKADDDVLMAVTNDISHFFKYDFAADFVLATESMLDEALKTTSVLSSPLPPYPPDDAKPQHMTHNMPTEAMQINSPSEVMPTEAEMYLMAVPA
eukprot:CAMPEP_0172479612 /NCGR_PEP_ID=MMETSP1066-20121228/4345_1 /TAXON_ID=671091 /ORGANISM="Coscinodiscus wailesii, Strain CCMP2513" /LENGTH=224 /DNA_ID=CAMNT_0013240259 /DNA_START=101 /DNA_END=772 /DNA_ORIENTATION=+